MACPNFKKGLKMAFGSLGVKVYAQFATTLSNWHMCEGGMGEGIFFLSWRIDMRKITYFCTIYFPILKLVEFF
jgi:hypothetical protein